MPDIPTSRAELHRHLEGSLRLSTLLELADTHDLPLPASDLHDLQRVIYVDHPMPDLLDFMPRFNWLRSLFVDEAACRRVTWECLEDAVQEGLGFVELRFSPFFMAEPHGLDPFSVTAAVCEAWQETQGRLPIESSLTCIMSRTYGPEVCQVELDCALAYQDRGIVGLDLAGDEARHPAGEFVGHFHQAREAGLRLTAHAGEFAGAPSVRETVELLGVERLGHAVHAVDDPSLLDLLLERGITIESCPTSNLFTGSVPNLAAHPLPRFLEHGIRVALCTDDPTIFGEITLEHEYRLAREGIGLTDDQLAIIHRNTWEAAFLP